MKTLHLSLSFSPRLLNSSTESDLWRVGGLSVDSTTLTTELSLGEGDSQVRAEGSRCHRGQQQDKPAEVYGALASSGPARGGNLKGEVGEGVMTGQGGLFQGHGEGHLIPVGQDNEHLRPSQTGKDSGRSFKGDEVDSSAWSIHSRAGQKISKDSTADGSPNSDKSIEGNSNIWAGDRGGTAFTTKVSCGDGGRMDSGGGSMEAEEGLSAGQGAFMLFRRDPAKQPSTTPTQHTMVLLCTVYSKEVFILPAPWLTL